MYPPHFVSINVPPINNYIQLRKRTSGKRGPKLDSWHVIESLINQPCRVNWISSLILRVDEVRGRKGGARGRPRRMMLCGKQVHFPLVSFFFITDDKCRTIMKLTSVAERLSMSSSCRLSHSRPREWKYDLSGPTRRRIWGELTRTLVQRSHAQTLLHDDSESCCSGQAHVIKRFRAGQRVKGSKGQSNL